MLTAKQRSTGCGSSAGSVSDLPTSGPKMDPRIYHILLWEIFPSSAELRRASCQLLANEWALSTGKLPLGGFPRNSVVN